MIRVWVPVNMVCVDASVRLGLGLGLGFAVRVGLVF